MNIQNGLPYGGGATMAAPRRKPNSSLKTGVGCYRAIKLSCVAMGSRLLAQNKPHSGRALNDQQVPGFGSALRRKNDAEHYSLIQAFLPRSADMSATIWRHHIVDPVIGNRRPFTVHLDLVMVSDHAALRRPAVH